MLPAASFLEFDDLVSPYFDLSMSAQAKPLHPMGDALPNQEIFRRLAKAMGYKETELFEDDHTTLDTLCRQVGLKDFASLAPKGTVDMARSRCCSSPTFIPDTQRQDRDRQRNGRRRRSPAFAAASQPIRARRRGRSACVARWGPG